MLLAGATPAQSKANLAQWLDVTIQGMTKYDTLVYAGANREWGFFHHILLDEFIRITSALSEALSNWGQDCQNNGFSCGRLYFVGGKGHGSVTFEHQSAFGPFLS